MRCFSCSKLSVKVICHTCQTQLLVPTIGTRKVGTLDVISFFKYTTLESLLHTKHKPEGYRVYKYLANLLFKPFMKEFIENADGDVYIVGIDEYVKNGYSHVSVLTHAMKMPTVIVEHSTLLAYNRVKYSGKTLQYRLSHPRDFKYRGKSNIDVILVDDIITTGITLQEAYSVLTSQGVNVLFALTLADVEES
ncbi:MAG: ComF family protein [Campylobacterota bacterium]|nr:ComF family protein [Campylobacterota bacterium]